MRQYGERRVFSVRGVVTAVWRRFQDLPSFWVQGEITNLSTARGSQVYFTLVDTDHADPTQIDCQMQANVFERLPAAPAEGQLVQAYGRIEFWRGRSTVRIRVERLEATGEGLLLARIAELRARLVADGLTAPERKRPLPFLPRRVGLVAAKDGAARADVITNVARRMPGTPMVVVTTLVQGDGAPNQIARAVRYLDDIADVDVIVLARGGGALEDLMAFNSEIVCRAVAASATPVVSAVGHETDVTLCDEVADRRASTPTQAAELVVPDRAALVAGLDRSARALLVALQGVAARRRERLDAHADRLRRELRAVGLRSGQRVDIAAGRVGPALRRVHRAAGASLGMTADRLATATGAVVRAGERRVDRAGAMLEVLSPQRTLERGYAIVRDAAGGVVGDSARVGAGARLSIELRDAILDADVVGSRGKETG